MENKLFDIKEANALLPQLSAAFSRISVLRREIGSLMEALRSAGFEPLKASKRELPEEPVKREKAQRMYKLLDALRAEVEMIEETGGILKDLEMGLMDFYGLREGKVVCLCWQHGEPEIMYWHEVETGFGSRQPISEDTTSTRSRLN
jgi:hypothetical protein